MAERSEPLTVEQLDRVLATGASEGAKFVQDMLFSGASRAPIAGSPVLEQFGLGTLTHTFHTSVCSVSCILSQRIVSPPNPQTPRVSSIMSQRVVSEPFELMRQRYVCMLK